MKQSYFKMGGRIVLPLFFLFLLVIPLVSAVPPVLQTIQSGSLEIISPTWEEIPQSTSLDIYWHLFNTTTVLKNTTATCSYHLYSKFSGGKHIYTNNNVTEFINGLDFKVEVSGGNFSNLGEYCNMIECWTATQTGGLERCFLVTKTGMVEESYPIMLYLLVISFIILLMGIYFEVYTLALLGGLVSLPLSLNVITNGLGNVTTTATTVFGIVMLGVAMLLTAKAGLKYVEEGYD